MWPDLHRCKAWASIWLKRYDEEGIEGLRDRPKSGRHSQMPEQTEYKIKTMLKEGSQGWTTKQVEELIIKVSGKHYHHIHTCAFFASGALSRRCQERCMSTLFPKMRRTVSKKGHRDTCG
jgi:transposase